MSSIISSTIDNRAHSRKLLKEDTDTEGHTDFDSLRRVPVLDQILFFFGTLLHTPEQKKTIKDCGTAGLRQLVLRGVCQRAGDTQSSDEQRRTPIRTRNHVAVGESGGLELKSYHLKRHGSNSRRVNLISRKTKHHPSASCEIRVLGAMQPPRESYASFQDSCTVPTSCAGT